MKLYKLPLHVAIVAAMGVGAGTYAAEGQGRGKNSSVDIDKDVKLEIDVEHRGYIQTLGLVLVDSTATSVSEVNQKTKGNEVYNGFDTKNNATADGNALRGASGNVGLNVAAGDNNVQQNSTAISRIESPTDVGVSVQAGYTETIHQSSEDNFTFDYEADRAFSYDKSKSGSVEHNSAKAQSVTATGTYDHLQDEHSTSETIIDAPVTGDINYDFNSSSSSEKDMELPAGKYAELEHGQSVDWSTSKDANLQVDNDTEGNPTERRKGRFAETDTTSTNSSTAISADFDTEASKSEDNHFDKTWSEDLSKSSSSSKDIHKDSHDESSYDYTEFAAVDANLVFGAALDAETFSNQAAYGNETNNYGVTNTARLGGNLGQNASGNVGVNVTSGNSNVQANQLAIAAGTGAVMAMATASSNQYTGGNTTDNASQKVLKEVSRSRIRLNQVGTAEGTYSGYSDQVGDVYPDIWQGGEVFDPNDNDGGHTGGSYFGHFDLDGNTQGSLDANDVAGPDHPANAEGGAYLFKEAGDITLGGIKLVGGAVTKTWGYVGHTNNASIGGNALRGATGNIGVNVSAGTNNLQGNALAISSVRMSANGGGNGGNGEN